MEIVVSFYFGGKSHVSNGQDVSFKEPCRMIHQISLLNRLLADLTLTLLEKQKKPTPKNPIKKISSGDRDSGPTVAGTQANGECCSDSNPIAMNHWMPARRIEDKTLLKTELQRLETMSAELRRKADAIPRSRNGAPAKCASIWKGASEDKSTFSGGRGAAFRFAGADLSVHGSFHKGLICGSFRARRGAGQGEALLEVETPTF